MAPMPQIFRHLAAAVLPLSATAAGILAVGIAVQLPRGPSAIVSAPPVVSPLEPTPAVVAHLPSTTKRPVPPTVARQSALTTQSSGVVTTATSQSSAPSAPAAAPPTEPTTSSTQQPSLPRSTRKPRVAEEAAALTPPVAVQPTATLVAMQKSTTPTKPAAAPSRRLASLAGVTQTSSAAGAPGAKEADKCAEKAAKKAAGQARKDAKKPIADPAEDSKQPGKGGDDDSAGSDGGGHGHDDDDHGHDNKDAKDAR